MSIFSFLYTPSDCCFNGPAVFAQTLWIVILSRDDSALCRNKQKVYFVLRKLFIPNNTIILKMKASKGVIK